MKDSQSDGFELFIAKVGGPLWRRFLIQNSKEMFWNGKVWVNSLGKAQLYYWYEEAASTIKQIEQDIHKGKPVVKYQIPVICEVIGDRPLDAHELMEYISKGTKLSMTLPNPEGLVIPLQMDVAALKELRNAERKDNTGN